MLISVISVINNWIYGINVEEIIKQCEVEKIMVANGSYCGTKLNYLKHINFNEEIINKSSLWVSYHLDTTLEQIDHSVAVICDLLRPIRIGIDKPIGLSSESNLVKSN